MWIWQAKGVDPWSPVEAAAIAIGLFAAMAVVVWTLATQPVAVFATEQVTEGTVAAALLRSVKDTPAAPGSAVRQSIDRTWNAVLIAGASAVASVALPAWVMSQ